MTETVNGRIDHVSTQLDEVGDAVGSIAQWTRAHDRRHGHERRQLIGALGRQGITPPDGWTDPSTNRSESPGYTLPA